MWKSVYRYTTVATPVNLTGVPCVEDNDFASVFFQTLTYWLQARQHHRYGKMFREKWGTKWQVHVSDPELIEKVYRHDGRYPHRPCLQSWVLHRRLVGKPNGLFTA